MQNKITWQDLQNLQKLQPNPPAYSMMFNKICYRSEEVQEAYDNHREGLRQLGMTTAEHIRKELDVRRGDTFIQTTPNQYPYNLIDNILHYVIWVSDNLSDMTLYGKTLTESNIDFVILQSPEGSRSIPEITHYHLFIKN